MVFLRAILVCCLSGLAVVVLGSQLVAAELPLGIVAEQPASGRFVKTDQGYMIPYTAKMPVGDAQFRMVPIPGGKFRMGSPASERGRRSDEGPLVEIEVPPFWMAECEVTLGEFQSFMNAAHDFKSIAQRQLLPITPQNKIDVVSAPSFIYDPDINFQLGTEPRRPATTMTQFSAKQYTKWLSGLSGQVYRLPTEAEWEYACRAGTSTSFSFDGEEASLKEYAWFKGNSEETSHLVGQKKPNPWGLYDMHGNVAEWTIDGYDAEAYKELSKQPRTTTSAIRWPTKIYPRVLRGGSWDDDPDRLRSAARIPSDDELWQQDDPNYPQSPWWFSSNYFIAVGFRIMRPLAVPPRAEQEKFWQGDLEAIQKNVKHSIEENGRGAYGVATPELLQLLKKKNEDKQHPDADKVP